MIKFPPGSLDPEYIDTYIRPLFSRTLVRTQEAYFANHSLGRPLDRVHEDLAEFSRIWVEDMDNAWDAWRAEASAFSANIASLVGLPNVVHKSNCGQGLRAVLNSLGDCPHVVASTGEFDSIDFILRVYEQMGRAKITWVPPARSESGIPIYDAEAYADALQPGVDLVVASAVIFKSGQVFRGLEDLREKAHAVGARMMVDAYHAVGVLPQDLNNFDYAVGGCYKYLRGGPGACWLAIHDRHIEDRTSDTGWFAKKDTFRYERPEIPEFAAGVQGWWESTPSIAPLYQARSGLLFTVEVGVDRLREQSLATLTRIRRILEPKGGFVPENPEDWGAFALLPTEDTGRVVGILKSHGVNVDARQGMVRFGPDVLTTEEDLDRLQRALGAL